LSHGILLRSSAGDIFRTKNEASGRYGRRHTLRRIITFITVCGAVGVAYFHFRLHWTLPGPGLESAAVRQRSNDLASGLAPSNNQAAQFEMSKTIELKEQPSAQPLTTKSIELIEQPPPGGGAYLKPDAKEFNKVIDFAKERLHRQQGINQMAQGQHNGLFGHEKPQPQRDPGGLILQRDFHAGVGSLIRSVNVTTPSKEEDDYDEYDEDDKEDEKKREERRKVR
jgi:hypothetical protein